MEYLWKNVPRGTNRGWFLQRRPLQHHSVPAFSVSRRLGVRLPCNFTPPNFRFRFQKTTIITMTNGFKTTRTSPRHLLLRTPSCRTFRYHLQSSSTFGPSHRSLRLPSFLYYAIPVPSSRAPRRCSPFRLPIMGTSVPGSSSIANLRNIRPTNNWVTGKSLSVVIPMSRLPIVWFRLRPRLFRILRHNNPHRRQAAETGGTATGIVPMAVRKKQARSKCPTHPIQMTRRLGLLHLYLATSVGIRTLIAVGR